MKPYYATEKQIIEVYTKLNIKQNINIRGHKIMEPVAIYKQDFIISYWNSESDVEIADDTNTILNLFKRQQKYLMNTSG